MPSTTPNLPPGSDHLLRRKANPRHEVILSVDLGKAQDYSCYTVVEAVPKTITNLAGRRLNIMELEVLNIRRLPLGTDYMDVSEHIRDVYRDPRLWLKPPGPGVPTAPTLIAPPPPMRHLGASTCQIAPPPMSPAQHQARMGEPGR